MAMTTIERAGYAQNLAQALYNTVVCMRSNTKTYQDNKANAGIKDLILADNAQYKKQAAHVLNTDQAALSEVCGAKGLDLSEVLGLANTIKAVTEATDAAKLDTPSDIDAHVSTVLTALPKFQTPTAPSTFAEASVSKIVIP